MQLAGIAIAPHEIAHRQRRIQGDCGQLPPQQGMFALFAQARGHLRGAAQAQERHLVHARQQCVQRFEMRQQHRRRLAANAGDAGNVVDRVATQRQVIGDLVRMHAVSGLDPVGVPALVAGEVVLLIKARQQLRQVLVRRHDHAAEAIAACNMRGAADQVVSFVILMRQRGQTQRAAQALAPGKLAAQFRWRRIAVGLVGRVQGVAEAGIQRLVEGDCNMGWPLVLQQFQQETGEAVHRVGRPAINVVEFIRYRMPGAEHVHRRIDEVQRRHGLAHSCIVGADLPATTAPPAGSSLRDSKCRYAIRPPPTPPCPTSKRRSVTSVATSGRSRSGTSTCAVPMAMMPASCSSADNPSTPSRNARS